MFHNQILKLKLSVFFNPKKQLNNTNDFEKEMKFLEVQFYKYSRIKKFNLLLRSRL